MATVKALLRNTFGHLLGLDEKDNLVIGGAKIYYGNRADGVTPQGSVDLSTIAPSGGALYSKPVASAGALGSGPYHNLGVAQIAAYVSGTTDVINAQAAAGGTTIGGVDMSGASDGFTFILRNPSTVGSLTILDEDGTATYQFQNDNQASEIIPPRGRALVLFTGGILVFL